MAKTSNYSFSTVFGLAGRPEIRYRFHARASATLFALMFTQEVAQEYRKKPNFKERFHGANSHVVQPRITYGVKVLGF